MKEDDWPAVSALTAMGLADWLCQIGLVLLNDYMHWAIHAMRKLVASYAWTTDIKTTA